MSVKPIPDGYHSVTPYLVLAEIPPLIDFLVKTFDAVETQRITLPDGTVRHAEVCVGDSKIMMGQGTDQWPPFPAALYIYVEDVDESYERALAAGGSSLMPPENQFYGDRGCGVIGPMGNSWFIASRVEDIPSDELQRRAIAAEEERLQNGE